VQAEKCAQPPFCTIALNGISHGGTRSDHADSEPQALFILRAAIHYWPRVGLCTGEPPRSEGVALVATSRLPHILKVALGAQVLLWEEACGAWHRRGRVAGREGVWRDTCLTVER